MIPSVLQHSFPEIATMLAERIDAVVEYLLPNGVRHNNEWCVGSMAGEAGQSLKIRLVGAKVGVWKDFASNESGGDLLDLWH